MMSGAFLSPATPPCFAKRGVNFRLSLILLILLKISDFTGMSVSLMLSEIFPLLKTKEI